MQWSHMTSEMIDSLIDQQILGHAPGDICQGEGMTVGQAEVACKSCAFHGSFAAIGFPHIRQAPHYSVEWKETRLLIADLARQGWEITLTYKGLRLHVTVRRPYMAAWQTADFTSAHEADAAAVCHAILKVAGFVRD